MPRTDEATAFFHAVYAAVQEIPFGKVTSYGLRILAVAYWRIGIQLKDPAK